ncbi:MAG: hypothetical protein ACAI44_32490 [Candidatus Sericytochromatia bacterium]
MEHEFTDQHKDSFVRSGDKSKAAPQPKPAEPPPSPPEPPKAPARPGEQTLDDFVPDKVGNVVDNVFGKLDNLVNDAADYLFGNKKKGGGLLEGDAFTKTQSPMAVPPLARAPQAPPPIPTPEIKPLIVPTATPAAPTKPTPVRTLSTLQTTRKPEMIRPVMPESKPNKKSKYDGPIISRTTSISELDLPLEILDDQDLPRYFDQMKLYEAHVVQGGLCNLPQYEASMALRRGKWKNDFGVSFDDLKKLDPGIYPMEMAKSRFFGMRPVYKAQGYRFSNKEDLIKAIETDINAYLTGKQGKGFHPFIYQVVSTMIK